MSFMERKIKPNKNVYKPDETQEQLNAWDYLHLLFARDAPSISENSNAHLAKDLTKLGLAEHYMMYLYCVISCLIIYFLLWIYQGEINHLEWLPVLCALILMPLLPSGYYYLQNNANKLTYKKFALGQVILALMISYGWLSIGLKLAPQSGVIQGVCFGVVSAAIVYSIIWFKTVPVVTFITTVIYGVVMGLVTSTLLNAQLSQILTLLFLIGANVIGLYLYVREIAYTLNQLHVNKLQRMNELLVKTFEKNSKDFLWQANNQGEITYASNQLQQLIEAQIGNDTMAEPNVLLNKNNQFGSLIKNYIHSEKNFEMFLAKLEYEGMMEYWAVTGDPLYDENGFQIGFSGFGTNMTAVKQEERRKNQVENYQSIARMATMIGNDFNKHLKTLVNYLNLPSSDNNSLGRDVYQKIFAVDAAQNALGMTTKLLELGNQKSGSLERIIVYQFLDQLLDELKDEYPKEVKIIPNISCSSFIHADKKQFTRCIRNVIENSIAAMRGNGTIYIDVETLKAHSLEIERYMLDKPGKTSQDYAHISIKDSGPGFPIAKIDHIFEPFVTTKEKYGNRGLGLAMVDNFCIQLQGFVLATNTNQGALLEIVIPQEVSKIPDTNSNS